MKKTNKTDCESDFPQEAIDARAAVLIDVGNTMDQADEVASDAWQMPATGRLEQKPTAKAAVQTKAAKPTLNPKPD